MATYGHIGSFYFGPVERIVSVNTINLTASILAPTTTGSVEVIFTPAPLLLNAGVLEPSIYSSTLIDVSFVGVPRNGSSPLIVDFVATVKGTGYDEGDLEVIEYRWYFDYVNYPAVYESTDDPTVTHTYTGYSSQKYDVKLCVIVDER